MTNSEKTKKEVIKIRLYIDPNEEKSIYDNFIELREKLGLRANTEVLRYCIKKTYETEIEKQ